ncbi:MAG TPA: transporter substrate-binding domain-containing protein, partial [Casimicrobiaceae bacterium]
MFGAGTLPASADALQDITSRGTIKVGMLVDFPPYGLMNPQNQPDGYDADVAKLLAQDLNLKLQLIPVTGPNRIPYLLSGQVDVLVASLGITPERAKSVDFSEPYAAISIGVYGTDDVKIAKPEDLAGKTIAVARASTQ